MRVWVPTPGVVGSVVDPLFTHVRSAWNHLPGGGSRRPSPRLQPADESELPRTNSGLKARGAPRSSRNDPPPASTRTRRQFSVHLDVHDPN